MTLGEKGVMIHDTLQLHCQQTLALVVIMSFLWLNKSRHASSSIKICILVTIVPNTTVAKIVHVATGKQETVKEAQVWHLIHEDI